MATLCKDKKRFPLESYAREISIKRGMRYYYCPHCKGYHLTSQAYKEKKPTQWERIWNL